MIRVIYMLESIDSAGNLVYRYFARNKRAAARIVRRHPDAPNPVIRKLQPWEMQYVTYNDVEGA